MYEDAEGKLSKERDRRQWMREQAKKEVDK